MDTSICTASKNGSLSGSTGKNQDMDSTDVEYKCPILCPEFSVLWTDLEAYITKRLVDSPECLLFLAKMLGKLQSFKLRVEELAYLIGCAFSELPDIALCMSLFLPDRAVIYVGKPAAAMCALIHNIAPDKYVIFNSILKSCMAHKGTKEILLHKMQLLFRGNPLVIRAIRKLLVRQFCMEKNVGAILQNQPIEIIKPYDEEPAQVHSVYNLAYQVGMTSSLPNQATVFASEILYMIRQYLNGNIHFMTLSDELDRIWSAYTPLTTVLEDIKQQIWSITDDDISHAAHIVPILKIIGGQKEYSSDQKERIILVLCDLFLHYVGQHSVTIRLEVSNLISLMKSQVLSNHQGIKRVSELLSCIPLLGEMFGCLIRLFYALYDRKRRRNKSNTAENAVKRICKEPRSDIGSAFAYSHDSDATKQEKQIAIDHVRNDSELTEILMSFASDAVSPYIMPARLKTQQMLFHLIGKGTTQPVYALIDEWNSGLLSKEEVVASLTQLSSKDSRARHAVRSLVTLLDNKRGGRQRRLTGSLSRQFYDPWVRQGSYRRLPAEWPMLECNGRNSLCWEVLNDKWASFPDNSESQPRNTNRHEEMLLRLEDIRYDWDLRIIRLESCIIKVDAISKSLKNLSEVDRKKVCIRPSIFSQVDIECFRRIFGTNVEQVLSYLCASPLYSIDKIYSTLVYKLVQWMATRELLGFAWAAQEQPHWAGAIDFKRRFGGEKRGME